MNKTSIAWTDYSWNITSGCEKISKGCTNCYAEQLHTMRHKAFMEGKKLPPQYSKPFGEIQLHPERLKDPLSLRKPSKIFVNSMSDLFHPGVPFEFVDKVLAIMSICREHTFQILTKRPDRMLEYFNRVKEFVNKWDCEWMDNFDSMTVEYSNSPCCLERLADFPLPNVCMGVSVEDNSQRKRIEDLLVCPAAKRFVSVEPMLGGIDLTDAKDKDGDSYDFLTGNYYSCNGNGAVVSTEKIDWVICGGESGKNARPMHPDWVRSLRDQCKAAETPFFFKQWGEWAPDNQDKPSHHISGYVKLLPEQKYNYPDGSISYMKSPKTLSEEGFAFMSRVGVKKAGHLLDGIEYREFPK